MSYNLSRLINNLSFEVNNSEEYTFINSNDTRTTPNLNTLKLYSKNDSNIYKLDDDGKESIIASSGVIGGNVYGPADSIDNGIVLFDGVSGKTIKQNVGIKYQDGFGLITPDIETSYTFSLNDELKKVQNIDSATPNITNINGLIKVPELAVNKIYDINQNIILELDTTTFNVGSTEFNFNGVQVATIDDIKNDTARVTALETKTQHITADPDFTTVGSILQAPIMRCDTIGDYIGDVSSIDLLQTGIQMFVTTPNPMFNFNDKPIVSTPYIGTIQSQSIAVSNIYDYNQGISIDLNSTTVNVVAPYLNFNDEPVIHQNYPSYIQATSFIKTGGTNIQYLMANGSTLTASANSGNSNYYLYNNSTTLTTTPSNGDITYNSANQSTATIIYISHRTRDNIDIEVFFKQLSTLTDVYIQDQETSLNYIQYNITATPVITPEFQVAITVVATSGAGTGLTSFGNGHNILVSFFTNTQETNTRLTRLENLTQNIASITVGIDTNFQGTLTSTGFIKSGGTASQFLKANGGVDVNNYINTQYLMNVSTSTLISSAVETTMNGTGLTTNNMSMTWTDAINYSRSIYISGLISHLSNATLTMRFRNSGGGQIIIPWVINMANTSVSVSVPFTMNINYTIKNNNLYTASCRYDEAGSVSGTSHMYNATTAGTLGNFSRLITAQWGASSAQNALFIAEMIIKNNYVG